MLLPISYKLNLSLRSERIRTSDRFNERILTSDTLDPYFTAYLVPTLFL